LLNNSEKFKKNSFDIDLDNSVNLIKEINDEIKMNLVFFGDKGIKNQLP